MTIRGARGESEEMWIHFVDGVNRRHSVICSQHTSRLPLLLPATRRLLYDHRVRVEDTDDDEEQRTDNTAPDDDLITRTTTMERTTENCA